MPSLYRKWRSRSFDDLVGQEHVVRTLRNAIRQGRVAHAYLFTGPRGTGKTSSARILAKAVNCLNPQDGNPCNACDACIASDEGRAIDVIEIDAASNTSVENVRDLRERVAYAAGEGKFKVYIVDEVHRLSGAAFDAFLKTLEEPPAHVIFVFASTEPQKVPATIASRCQRFDFRRIPAQTVRERVRFVAQSEAIDIDDEALELIALQAAGSLRDGLGVLDQVASYTAGRIDSGDVRQALGLADPLLVARLTDDMLGDDIGGGLREATEFFDAGGDPKQLLHQLVAYWRALLILVSGGKEDTLEIDPALRLSLAAHATQLTPAVVLRVLQSLTASEFSPRYDVAPTLPFEAGYVQAALDVVTGRPAASPVRPRPEIREIPPHREAQPDKAATSSAEAVTIADIAPAPDPEVATRLSNGSVDLNDAWSRIVEQMRTRSLSLQALLRGAGYLLEVGDGEVTIGFLYDFHRNQFADAAKRRQLEEVVSQVLGSSYRARVVRTTKSEVESIRGSGTVQEDDGFVEEAVDRLREYHVRQLGSANS
ncbi:MAG TPA: DNA polymerase III subunit gamma/tau [Chloroflexota bacterium]|nr:DNA polymerase III subunit gamma/tau [Chloroflexota bacterium]